MCTALSPTEGMPSVQRPGPGTSACESRKLLCPRLLLLAQGTDNGPRALFARSRGWMCQAPSVNLHLTQPSARAAPALPALPVSF